MNRNQEEQVALVAYRCWEERGRPSGSPDADWYRAEKEFAETGLSKVARKAGWMAGKIVTVIRPK